MAKSSLRRCLANALKEEQETSRLPALSIHITSGDPRFDHQYTVFAQILNGGDVVDQLLEGDVIESILIDP